MSKRAQGAEFEDKAVQYLLSEGYTIVTRRHQVGHREIDIIALDGESLVFVEVKSRNSSADFAEESLTLEKVDRVIEAGEAYMRLHGGVDRPARFDVITFSGNVLRHHKGAYGR